MTDKVLQEVRAEMRERGLTQLELAKRIAANNQYVNDILTGKRGTISKRWEDILDELGLELTVTPKTSASGAPYSGDPETDELLDDVELMARRAAL